MFKTRTLFVLLVALLLALWIWSSRQQAALPSYDRPNDPWVFRSVLDKQPRMITFALDDKLWVAYSTDSCALYKAWSGGVDFEGAVYNMRHGPQPTTVGSAWFENQFRRPWTVTLNGKPESPVTDYKGHRYTKDGHAEIMFDLVLSDGRRIRINEQPEYVEKDRQSGYSRTFRVENAPDGAVITLKTNAGSIAATSAFAANGALLIDQSTDFITDDQLHTVETVGTLALKNKGNTVLTTMFVNHPLYKNPNAATPDEEEGPTLSPGERLIAKNDCRTCHNPRLKTVGPSYVEISEHYKNTPGNLDLWSKKVVAGGSGVWGIAAMSAHPDLQPDDARSMVTYILSLDEGEDDGEGGSVVKDLASIPSDAWQRSTNGVGDADVLPGLVAGVFQLNKMPTKLAEINFKAKPDMVVIAPEVNAGGDDFGPLKENFAIQLNGYLFMEKDDNVLLQLSSDDGSKLWIDDKLLVDADGLHGAEPHDVEVALRAGFHQLRIDYFQGGGGRGIYLKWARPGSGGLQIIPASNLFHNKSDNPEGAMAMGGAGDAIPGDGSSLKEVHPAYTLSQARPESFLPKVSGMDFLSDGRMVVTCWDAMGGVYLLSNVESGDPAKIKVKLIARGLAEPLGVKVVNDTIYVLQKQELTRLIDLDGDEIIDEYQCFAKGWRASANFHEFAFGLAYKDGYFYATLAIAIMPGGASARPQIPDRGKVIRISKKDGSLEFIARGLRTPNGVGIGVDNEIFVADNQGDWLPASKILHVKKGSFFGSYAVDSINVAGLPVQLPVVWLPQDEIGNSPSTPLALNDGPYKGQMIHGEVTHGGVKRVFVEKVNGDYQGCVFRFTQGLEAGINRMVWGPDGALYVGGIGNPGNWSSEGKLWYGLQRLKYNGTSVFEMLAVRAKGNGMEIEFTEPLKEGDGWDPAQYEVKQWWYKPTINYGGPKMDETPMAVKSASVSADRKKVFLEISGLLPGHVVYLRLHNLPESDMRHELWSTEAWYTLNNIPADQLGSVQPKPAFPPKVNNSLSQKEISEGWKLLFDGQSFKGWHKYGAKTVDKDWVVQDGAMFLDAKPDPKGGWQSANGGDLISDEEYEDFELELEWKMSPCGNSGIFYYVLEDPAKYENCYMTGLEMQVLDNACHPDSRYPKHKAGDLYDLIACKYITVNPAMTWNHVRILSKDGKVEQWQNHHKVVSFDRNSPEFKTMLAESKFRDWPDFGVTKKGRIGLQDHGFPVWYRNVKVRRL
ncbi:MAG: DUF1080 domain-containing protein [Lewinellaceae bacterium]|nr:DUF1080 domain-containing protein [Lewinellaceae bacterium]